MTAEELVQEACAAAVAAGIGGDQPSEPHDKDDYFSRLRDIADGLLVTAGHDKAILQDAMGLALREDASQVGGRYMSGGTRALCLAVVRALPRDDDAALQAAVLAEGQTAGSSAKLAARRVQAIADLTRWEPETLAEAVRLVPTGIVRLSDIPDGAAIARDILLAAREALEAMGPTPP